MWNDVCASAAERKGSGADRDPWHEVLGRVGREEPSGRTTNERQSKTLFHSRTFLPKEPVGRAQHTEEELSNS